MSDYMFMLENHLSADQNLAVSMVQAAAAQANVNLFLTGGAVRDMLGGFRIRDLDFTVEGNALKVAKAVAEQARAKVVATDEHRRSVDLLLPGGVTMEIAMARQERWPRAGGQPVITHASIQEDLLSRDFTVNAIALSLNKASMGLLLDPNNGRADIDHKELRAVHNRVLLDDPGRLLRLFRFRVRLGYTIEARTQSQYENARLEEMEKRITGRRLFEELQLTAREPSPGEVLQALEHEKFLAPFAPFLTGPKLNLAGFARLLKARQLVPFGVDLQADSLALFLHLLLEKLTPKERLALAKALGMRKSELELPLKLAASAKKLEKELRSAKISKASHIYSLLSQAAGEDIMFLYLNSSQRLVQDRIRNYFQKYIPAAQEITDREIAALGHEPGSPKFKKAKEEMIKVRLDSRPKKPAPETLEGATEPAPPPGTRPPGRPGYGR
jgi:tRNA nucleotidyltransferase (CCA-adding enzyme)